MNQKKKMILIYFSIVRLTYIQDLILFGLDNFKCMSIASIIIILFSVARLQKHVVFVLM
jgi:hypothetical protein